MNFSYKFPVVRGVQAGREYYIAMVPLRMLGRLFPNEEEYVLPEYRAQRKLNQSRIPVISRYIIENRNSYVFSALAASIDGASRIQKIFHITLPALLPTIIVVFLMNIGSIMNVGFDKVLLMQNDLNREASDIISTFVYERGILEGDYGLSTAVGLFNSLINTAMLVVSNRLTKKVTGSGLW